VGLEPGVNLSHDRGCFHGLGDSDREGYARGVTTLAGPGAVFLLMSSPCTASASPNAAGMEGRHRIDRGGHGAVYVD
jgi:hypothetical protein